MGRRLVVWTVVVAKGVVVVVGNDFIIKSLVVGAIALKAWRPNSSRFWWGTLMYSVLCFSLKFCDLFLNYASSAAALLVFYLPGACVHK